MFLRMKSLLVVTLFYTYLTTAFLVLVSLTLVGLLDLDLDLDLGLGTGTDIVFLLGLLSLITDGRADVGEGDED